MDRRDISRLSIELRNAAECGPVISMSWLTRSETAAFSHEIALRDKDINNAAKIDELCRSFWNEAERRITQAAGRYIARPDSAGKLTDLLCERDQQCAVEINEIREESASLAMSIFDDRALEVIWELARECRILAIQTNMLSVPWEALVNPLIKDGQFLGQLCIISRVSLSRERNVPNTTEHEHKQQTALYVDAALDLIWKATKGFRETYDAVAAYSAPIVLKDVRSLFAHMRGVRFIHWICDNTFEAGTDRLRLAENVFCTPKTLLIDALSPSNIVLLLTCGHSAQRGGHQSIAASIAVRSGCTVICSHVPIQQFSGLHLVLMSLHHNSNAWASLKLPINGHVQVADIFEHLSNQGLIGAPSLFGMTILFFGIYGKATAELW